MWKVGQELYLHSSLLDRVHGTRFPNIERNGRLLCLKNEKKTKRLWVVIDFVKKVKITWDCHLASAKMPCRANFSMPSTHRCRLECQSIPRQLVNRLQHDSAQSCPKTIGKNQTSHNKEMIKSHHIKHYKTHGPCALNSWFVRLHCTLLSTGFHLFCCWVERLQKAIWHRSTLSKTKLETRQFSTSCDGVSNQTQGEFLSACLPFCQRQKASGKNQSGLITKLSGLIGAVRPRAPKDFKSQVAKSSWPLFRNWKLQSFRIIRQG